MQVPLIVGDGIDSTVDYRQKLPVNMYAVPYPIKGANGYMNQWYGLTEVTQGSGVDRGAIWVSRENFKGHYRVSDTSLVRVNSDSTITDLGDILGSKQASMAYSFNNLAIVSDGNLYYYNPTDGLRQITGDNVGSPIDIKWADNLFILTDGEDVYHSNPLDEEDFLPLDFSNPQFIPDPARGLGVNEDNELLVFGQFSIEPYRNIGNDNFVFQRITSKFLKLGVIGTHARDEMNGFWYVVGRREETSVALHQVRSGGEKKISTREVDKIFGGYTEGQLSDTVVECLSIDDIKLVMIHLPDKTIVYNETIAETQGKNNAFFVLKTDVLGDATYRAKNFVNDINLNKWVCGDKRDATIGFLDDTVATHYDDISEWELYTPLIPAEGISIDELELNTISGFSPDNDATVAFSMTYDGLFYQQEFWNMYTENHKYSQRFIMRRLGYIRDNFSMKFRGASRSRMNVSFLNVEGS